MKFFWRFSFSLCLCSFLGSAFSFAQQYRYDQLEVQAKIQEDGTIQVEEIFDTYFKVPKHGIYRDIPTQYVVEDTRFWIELEDIFVKDRTYDVDTEYAMSSIKIGDADIELTGNQKYDISYSVYGLVRNFSGLGYAELYWNIVGNRFDTKIHKFYGELQLPKVYTWFTSWDFLIAADGISDFLDDFEGTIDRSQGDKIILTYDKEIPAGNGITLSIKFPVDYFVFDDIRQASLLGVYSEEEAYEREFLYLEGISSVIMIFLCINTVIFERRVSKRMERTIRKRYGPIVVQYTPPKNMSSAEAGLLFHCRVDVKDLFSLLYAWVYRWIVEIKKNTDQVLAFKKLKDLPDNASEYEKKMFEWIFASYTVSFDKKSPRQIKLETIKSFEKIWIDTLKYFLYRGENSTSWINVGCFILFCILSFFNSMVFTVNLFFWGCVYFCVLWWGPQTDELVLSEKGQKTLSQLLWYKDFLITCDEQKLKTFLRENPNYVDDVIAYAVVFGLDMQIMEKIKNAVKIVNFEMDQIYTSLGSFSHIQSFCNVQSYVSSSHGGSYSSGSGFSSWSSFHSSSHSGHSWGGWGWWGGRSW